MRILLVHSGFKFSTTEVGDGFEKAFTALGHEVVIYHTREAMEFAKKSLMVKKIYEDDSSKIAVDDVKEYTSSHLLYYVLRYEIDLVFVIHGFNILSDIVKQCRKIGVTTALYLTDEPQQVDVSKQYSPCYDYVFTNDKGTLKYHKNSYYVPTAYNHHLYLNSINKISDAGAAEEYYKSDILLCGSFYLERQRFLLDKRLNSVLNKYNTKFVGHNASSVSKIYPNSFIVDFVPLSEMYRFYFHSKIVIDIPRNEFSSEFGDTNNNRIAATNFAPRIYEATACNVLVMTHDSRQEAMDELFPDGGIVLYKNQNDLCDYLEYYLDAKNSDEYYLLAHRAQKETQRNHTYVERASNVLKCININAKGYHNLWSGSKKETVVNTEKKWSKSWNDNFKDNIEEPRKLTDLNDIIHNIRDDGIDNKTLYIISNAPSLCGHIKEVQSLIRHNESDYFMTLNGSINVFGNVIGEFGDHHNMSMILHPTEDVKYNFSKVKNLNHLLLASSVVHPSVIDAWIERNGDVALFNTTSNLDSKQEKSNLPIIESGLTVGYSAIHCALLMGFKKIILVGLDMSYVNNYNYHKVPLEYKNNMRYYVHPDACGNAVLTSQVMLQCKLLILRLIARHPDVLLINATGGIVYGDGIFYQPDYLPKELTKYGNNI